MREVKDQIPAGLPIILRVAGLPADAVAPFASELCRDHLLHLQALEASCVRARAELVEALGGLIQGAPVGQRRFLLALKRDCFNARDLARYHAHPQWEVAAANAKSQVTQLHFLEGQLAAAQVEFEAAYHAERLREIRHLLDFLGDQAFLRGVALSSSAITGTLFRLLSKSPAAYGRRERRLVTSLLRYVSRSALKLSPFSSLTEIGLGSVTRTEGKKALQLISRESWQEHSKVRVQRYRIEEFLSLLIYHPLFRAHLPIAGNDTVEAVAADRYRLLRGVVWQFDPERSLLTETRPALVSVRLRGPLIRWLLDNAQAPNRTYRELLVALQEALPDHPGGTLQATVDKLLEIGFLCFTWPWATADSHPEKRLCEFLESLPEDETLTSLARSLRNLLALEEDFVGSDNPTALVAELRSLVRDMLRTAAPLAKLDPQVTDDGDENLLHEDVFCQSDRPGQEIALLSQRQAGEILANLLPFSRLSNAESLLFDFRHSLAAFARERWPGQEEVRFLDVFEEAYPLFEAYIKHDLDVRIRKTSQAASFNPYQLDSLERLDQARQRLTAGLRGCVAVAEGEAELDREALVRLLDEIPSPYSDPQAFSAFVQPLNDAGTEWVLNLLAEGVGRLSSRFTTTMDPSMQKSFSENFLRHSSWTEEGQRVELVDLFCSAGHSANVHIPYTPRVFELLGASAGLPADRCLRLRDLRVRFSAPHRPAELVDREHCRILPVHLGAVGRSHMPSLVKFLALFGPGEFRYRRPTLRPARANGVVAYARHRVGNVVYRRRTWSFETATLRAALSGLGEAMAFRLLNRWRCDLGIPERAFLAEPIINAPIPYTKPQYVDFTSPLLTEIFRSAIQKEIPKLELTEALPPPEGNVPAGRQRRAVELQLESMGAPTSVPTDRPLPRREGLSQLVH